MAVLSQLAVVLSLTFLTALPGAAQDRNRIYLGASSKTLGYSPLWVAVKR